MRNYEATLALLADAIAEIVRHRRTIIRAAFLPFAGLVLLDVLRSNENLTEPARYFFLAMTFPLWTMFATTVHRVILLGDDYLPSRFGLFWSERETRFLGWLIGLTVLYIATGLPVGILLTAIVSIAPGIDVYWLTLLLNYMVFSYFQGRFGLVLPATATDCRSNYKDAWAMSRGSGMIIATALLVPWMLLIPLEYVVYGPVDDRFLLLADIIWLVLVLPIYAVEVAILSLAFAKLDPQGPRPA